MTRSVGYWSWTQPRRDHWLLGDFQAKPVVEGITIALARGRAAAVRARRILEFIVCL